MHSRPLTKQPRWDERAALLQTSSSSRGAGSESLQKLDPRPIRSVGPELAFASISTFQWALCDEFSGQVVVEFVDPHG